ncbi:hypothetical protein SAMN06265367_104164 [Algoriphagus winogradskyi]|uniref:Uncharacterized protein n=1 Tax=Algoriphagus winogradskyi TaxID=237017 RepID=A0ABY1P3A1_9BACT|nr:hypothetical protein SAMN06265367_104164 [Algoriphagus winogradskyi]
MVLDFATLLCDLGVSAVKKKFEYATAAIVHLTNRTLPFANFQFPKSIGNYQVVKN